MSKKSKAKKTKNKIDEELIEVQKKSSILLKEIPAKYNKLLIAICLIIPLLAGIYFLVNSYNKNGYFGFPLDDPWIHLTFARNLIEYGSFSYFKNEIVTSGSTSPIYTLLLSVLFLISKNEYVISYVLGIIFNVLTVLFIYKLVSLHSGSKSLLTLSTVFLIALQPKLNLIAVSGMETSMFIFFIICTLYFYKTANKILLGIFLGLTIWCRPDGAVLWIAILVDYFFSNYSTTKTQTITKFERKDFLFALLVGAFLVALYFVFIYVLSGSILPNTYRAKIEYYQHNLRENFLKNEVLNYFSSAELILIVVPFLVAVLIIIRDIIKQRYNQFFVYLLFLLCLIAAYYIKLPFAHRFGRYLMPVIPFYILISVYGFKEISEFILQKTKSYTLITLLFTLFLGGTTILSIIHLTKNAKEFAELCKYHNERHVAAGLWIKKNTPQNSIVAIHDIGAIGFYSERKIIDMVGLVTPELIDHLNDKNFSAFIKDFLTKNNATHIAALKNWFEIVNDNPLYVPINQFEILEIYKFKPEQTHIHPREVSYLNEQAIQLAQNNNLTGAIRTLQQSLTIDPSSSRTNFLIGLLYEITNDRASAEIYFQKAISIFPDYLEANFGLARIYNSQGKLEKVKNYLNKCLEINPNYQPAREMMEKVNK